MRFGKLTRISTKGNPGPNALRTTSVEGNFSYEPSPGYCFNILGESLTPGMTGRMVTTSPVKTVEVTQAGFRFETENSVYELEVYAP